MRRQAAFWYRGKHIYTKAAEYAIGINDKKLLAKIILEDYREQIKAGNFGLLRLWFQALGNIAENAELLVAHGAYFSCIGNFIEAKKCLDAALPILGKDRKLRLEALLHKARVLRNDSSFEASDALLDMLIADCGSLSSETAYSVVIERLYNLCLNSRIKEAFALAHRGIEDCAREGNLRVRAWYERYLSAIHFFAGHMRESVFYSKTVNAIKTKVRRKVTGHENLE